MEWDEYIRNLLNEESVFDNMRLSISGETEPTGVPPIIKASILMLNRMIATQGQYNIFVFPERAQSAFIFALLETIYNIITGKIQKNYNPYEFTKGQKLKINNAVMEFDRIEYFDGRENIFVKFTDMIYGLPIGIAPYMQLADTNRLSKFSSFQKVFDIDEAVANRSGKAFDLVKVLQNYKTHMNSSIFYVSPVLITKEYLSESNVNGHRIQDILLFSHTNFDGDINNLVSGQLAGHPAMVLAADLYAASNAIGKGAPIQSLIIDVSNSGIIASQLDKIDELMRLGFPILCVTDIANSFNLQLLVDRGYNLWRWDSDSITTSLYGSSPITSDKKIKHCANRKVEYITTDGQEIGDSLKRLYIHRTEVKGQSPCMINLFDKLFSLTFTGLRNITPIDPSLLDRTKKFLADCELDLLKEKAFISDDTYSDYSHVIKNMRIIFSESFVFPKYNVLKGHLITRNYSSVCILIPERMDKQKNQVYWGKWCLSQNLHTNLTILYPSEFYILSKIAFSATIVVGWFNNNTMRKILYGFNTDNYIILLYDYECRWKNAHTAIWSRALNNENNRIIIKKSFCNDKLDISVTRFRGDSSPTHIDESDELSEIELILRENKYHQYVAGGGQRIAEETTEALPVSFVGGFLSFYKTTHKVITVTDIIQNDSDRITMKLPGQLNMGDFIIVRETDRDLIKEIADKILFNSGKVHSRELAMRWKEALIIENVFSKEEDIVKKLRAAGCTRGIETIHGWLMDDEKISPQLREDLESIALITGDDVLLETIDAVYEAGREVKNAHIQAGKYLSDKLKQKIVEGLRRIGEIDPFNIWEPITLSLGEIGLVRVLKIIDIGSVLVVDANNVNRLIEEN